MILFKKFYQADPTATRKHGGTGLGLTICKEIVEMHGGKIWYEISYGNGACFKFLLPRLPPTSLTHHSFVRTNNTNNYS
jgi:signal transduction histidine kinase